MEIQLSQALIRSFCTDDAASITRYANNRNVWLNLMDLFPHPYHLVDAKEFIAKTLSAEIEGTFAIVVDGNAVGGIGAHPQSDCQRRTAALGYWLGEPFWGRGIATETVRAITPWAMARFNLLRIEAGVFSWNPASCRVLEKAGYVFEGRLRNSIVKDGHVLDRLMYAWVA